MTNKILKLRAVQDWTGLSRASIYAYIKAGTFPKQVKLSERSVGWRETDIQSWIDSRQVVGV